MLTAGSPCSLLLAVSRGKKTVIAVTLPWKTPSAVMKPAFTQVTKQQQWWFFLNVNQSIMQVTLVFRSPSLRPRHEPASRKTEGWRPSPRCRTSLRSDRRAADPGTLQPGRNRGAGGRLLCLFKSCVEGTLRKRPRRQLGGVSTTRKKDDKERKVSDQCFLAVGIHWLRADCWTGLTTSLLRWFFFFFVRLASRGYASQSRSRKCSGGLPINNTKHPANKLKAVLSLLFLNRF